MDQPPGRRVVERQAVRARVEVDVREAGFDVLAHLDGALVQKRLAVIEKVDSDQRRPGFVHHPREQVEIQHAGLARFRDARLGRAASLRARDVARGRALDIHAAGELPHLQRSNDRRLFACQRQLERTVAAEPGPAGVEVCSQRGQRLSRPDGRDAGPSRIAQHAMSIRIRAAAHHAAVAEHHQRAPRPGARKPRGQIIQGHGIRERGVEVIFSTAFACRRPRGRSRTSPR